MSREKTKSAPSASVQLVGKTADDFAAVKARMEVDMPGVTIDRSSVIRYSLHCVAHEIQEIEQMLEVEVGSEK